MLVVPSVAVYVQVIVVFVVIGNATFDVPVIVSPHLFAVGAVNDVTAHGELTAGNEATFGTGFVVDTTIVCCCCEILYLESLYIHVTVLVVVIGNTLFAINPTTSPSQLSVDVGATN